MSKATNEIMAQAEKININDGEFLIVKIDMKKHGQLSWSKIEKASISELEEALKKLKGENNE